MFQKLKGAEERFLELEMLLSDPDIIKDREAYQKHVREHSVLSKIVSIYRSYKKNNEQIEESISLLKNEDPEIKELARDEIEVLGLKKEGFEKELRLL
ncbi:MAG: PCRF domain-containing protein, partial [Proteobacteria bacterium]|nr:PCRF domain-containing protein [Pseudomonadota bacterium]